MKNVAIVDDDASVRRALGRLLRAAGFQPVTYASAEEFLENGARDRTGCLLLDVHLGGMSGLELQRRLAAGGAVPPIVFITGHDEPCDVERAEEAGCVAFLRKPVLASELLGAVRCALRGIE